MGGCLAPRLLPCTPALTLWFCQATSSEGWPKVLSEAMAYGVVPIASNVSSIPQYLKEFGSGRAFAPDNLVAFAESIHWYSTNGQAWKRESENGVSAAGLFSYELHCSAVRHILQLPTSQAIASQVTPALANVTTSNF